MKVIDHRLYKDDETPYPYVESPNVGGKLRQEYLVMHYTAGRSAESSIRALTNPDAKVSAHLIIGRDGSVTQLVPFDTVAYHAGASMWEGRSGLNRYSIGIELDNAGKLIRHGSMWKAWFGKKYDDTEVIEAVHKNRNEVSGWHIYTEPQINAAIEVTTLLANHYHLLDVVGHDDIAPTRKTDPGPAFPMRSFRAAVLGRAEDEPVLHETTTHLNIRSGPGTHHPTIEGSPLPPGTKVEALNRKGSWWLVNVFDVVNDVMDIEGWVHSRFLRRTF